MHYIQVAGSRGYKHIDTVEHELNRRVFDRYTDIDTIIVHGNCPDSPDMIANRWADFHEIPCLRWPARWRKGDAGRGEGPIRNRRMTLWTSQFDVPSGNDGEFLGFWDGKSTGVLSCLRSVIEADLAYVMFGPDGRKMSVEEIHKALG